MVFIGVQPLRYGSRAKRKAKSTSMVTWVDGKDGLHHVACFGNDSHYQRETGQCCHIEGFRALLDKDAALANTYYLPFGKPDAEEMPLASVVVPA